jgi:hypothetical protein
MSEDHRPPEDLAPTKTSADVPSNQTPAPPLTIGQYRILGKLGEGGMGMVYEAQQERPKRKVAVKVVRGGQFVDVHRVLNDGTRLEGDVKRVTYLGPYIKSLTFVTDSGEKHKLKPADIEQLGVKLSGLPKWMLAVESADESSKTPWGLAHQLRTLDWKSYMTRDYALFDQVVTPKGKTRLLQRLNPGFDSRLKVYQHKMSLELGEEVKSLLIVKDGTTPFVVKKSSYRKQFAELYGDCQEFMDTFGGGRPKFWEVAGHVAVYDRICSAELGRRGQACRAGPG